MTLADLFQINYRSRVTLNCQAFNGLTPEYISELLPTYESVLQADPQAGTCSLLNTKQDRTEKLLVITFK